MANEMVSIIVPAYNCENYIRYTLDSLLNQTYTDFEVIVIDDGSIDQTFSIVNEYASTDIRVKLHKNNENLGVSKTRNYGLELASGQWIAFCDSDDAWVADKLEKQIEKARLVNARFVYTGIRYIDSNNNSYPGITKVHERIDLKRLLLHNEIACSSVLISSDLKEFVIMKGDSMSEDFASWINVLKHIDFAYAVNEPLCVYRLTQGSKSRNKFKSALMGYRAYRANNFNVLVSILYLSCHLTKSMLKYRNIKKFSSNHT